MPIITVSRGSYSRGKEVAHKVAERLRYECLSREILLEASKEFNVEEVKLERAIQNAPSFLERISFGKERYIAYIRAALLAHLKKDNVVYYGLAGHFFVRDIPHALKVRIIADLKSRIELVMKRDQVSKKTAEQFIRRIDNERRKWSKKLYGIDTMDATLYDLVIHIDKITIDDAADIICQTVRLKQLQSTEESLRAVEEEALAAAVKAALVRKMPEVDVTAENGTIHVTAKTTQVEEQRIAEEIEQIARSVPGVNEVEVHLHWFTPFGT